MKTLPIIEVEELLKIFRNPDVLLFDVSNSKNAKANFETEHLEGAVFVDLNTQLADIKNDVSIGGRHPMPSFKAFSKTLTELGIGKNSHVIIYDDKNSSNAAARFWWMLRSAGHEKVQVVNGGLNQAKKHNFPLSSGSEIPKKNPEPYQITNWKLPTVDINEVEKAAQDPNYIVVDVRDKDRYDGITEPIDRIAGHIPGAINIPFTENLDENGLFLKHEDLKNKYSAKFANTKPEHIIVHCGSGVTACHTLLALAYAGIEIPNLYVGSWSEWSRSNKKIESKTTDMDKKGILDKGPFYHGTKADLKIGDLLTAGFNSNYHTDVVMNHIYFTALPNGAGLAAELVAGDGCPRVYIVEPTGEFENDPNVTDKKFPGNPTRSYRSTAPIKIVGEVTDWTRLTPEELKSWREKLAALKANPNAEIIN